MEIVKCKKCDYKASKPKLEMIIYKVLKDGGSLKTNKCPKCKENKLTLKKV